MYDLALVNGLVFKDNKYQSVNIYIKDGVITNITPTLLYAKEIYDCDNNLVLPGIIDPHTHFDLDLGSISSRDNFFQGTKASAYGGITTIIDFLEPVNNAKDLKKAFNKRVLQAKESNIDYKFHACLKDPKNQVKEIVHTMKDLGLDTVKLFTTYSDSNRRTYDVEILKLLRYSKSHNFLVTAHIENDEMIELNKVDSFHKLPINRPTESEVSEALKLAQFVKDTEGYLYMVHLSSGETLKQLKEQFGDILNTHFFVESCPHYFHFNNEILNNENGYLYTMAPPLRSTLEQELLIKNFHDVYTIGTDHCSFNKADKQDKLLYELPLGIGGVSESFDIMYSIFKEQAINKMTINVAKAHKLYPKKGVIDIGSDADFFVYKLGERTLDKLYGNTDYSVYQGQTVLGEVISTISRGNFILRDSKFIGGTGNLLNKSGE